MQLKALVVTLVVNETDSASKTGYFKPSQANAVLSLLFMNLSSQHWVSNLLSVLQLVMMIMWTASVLAH